jgi:hypothetical protein
MSDLRTDHREFLSEFIDLYRENQCLWKIKSKDYRNKKNLAYEVLVEKLREIDSGYSVSRRPRDPKTRCQ